MIEKGIDALEFVNKLEGGWDTIIFDPPYYNKNNFNWNNWKNKNKKGDLFNEKIYVMSNDYRKNIEEVILSKCDNPVFIKFHTDIRKLNQDNKILIWYKSDRPITNLIGNCEFIEFRTHKRLFWKTRIFEHKYGKNRACEKPIKLFDFLYDIIGSKYILDPFAGYGNSIRSALNNNLKIDACDIDDSLNYNFDEMEMNNNEK